MLAVEGGAAAGQLRLCCALSRDPLGALLAHEAEPEGAATLTASRI